MNEDGRELRLSVQERFALLWIAQHQSDEFGWGMPWRAYPARGRTRAEQASLSRTLRRLETRGLIERLNQVSGKAPNEYIRKHRTTHLRILPLGIEAVKRLTQNVAPAVNHADANAFVVNAPHSRDGGNNDAVNTES